MRSLRSVRLGVHRAWVRGTHREAFRTVGPALASNSSSASSRPTRIARSRTATVAGVEPPSRTMRSTSRAVARLSGNFIPAMQVTREGGATRSCVTCILRGSQAPTPTQTPAFTLQPSRANTPCVTIVDSSATTGRPASFAARTSSPRRTGDRTPPIRERAPPRRRAEGACVSESRTDRPERERAARISRTGRPRRPPGSEGEGNAKPPRRVTHRAGTFRRSHRARPTPPLPWTTRSSASACPL